MTYDPALVILGAGPAGVGAALAAAECGLDALVVDAAAAAGGQVYRAMPETFEPADAAELGADYLEGERQRRLLAASPVATAFRRQIWSVGSDLRVDAVGPEGPESWRPRAIVVAAGTTERVVPFPGWTLPGVIGLAAATILLKSQIMLPGTRTVVAGCGPLLAAVAHSVHKHGGSVAAVVDLAGAADWATCLPAIGSRPRELLRGASWLLALRRAGVPVLFRHGIREVRENGSGLEVGVGPVDAARRPRTGTGERTLRGDCLTVGHGLVPATEVTRLLGAEHRYDAVAGGWIPILDADQRTTRGNLYAAGD
ncbi:MAG: FAD-dependent oxidoreductase, partial [Alphaproteobacteria bacterium]